MLCNNGRMLNYLNENTVTAKTTAEDIARALYDIDNYARLHFAR